jgi:hypothetical protein
MNKTVFFENNITMIVESCKDIGYFTNEVKKEADIYVIINRGNYADKKTKNGTAC